MSVSWLFSCIPQTQITVSKLLFDAYARSQNDSATLSILDTVRAGIIEDEKSAEALNLKAMNGERVNGLHFKGTEDKAIIWLHGNGCFYETSLGRPLLWREGLKREGQIPHLVVFNPRGTGRSEGRTQLSTVIEDLSLFFDYVRPKSVVIGGHSMGGYFTLFGAAELQKRYPDIDINFVSDRSLWDLRSRVSPSLERAGCTGSSKKMMTLYVQSVLNSPDWTRDSLAALESLKGRVLIIFHRKDGVVILEESTYQGLLKAHRTKEYRLLELEDPSMTEVSATPHNREFTGQENQVIIAELGRMLGIHEKPTSTILMTPETKV
ncbi:MAG: alpha/beta hydrolase [Chlamydiales bacterium]|nr:alpha/beta hydrolase [Chlamydiales bacterium]